MPCGESCACLGSDPPVECLSVVDPKNFGFLRGYCESGDALKRMHALNRSRIAAGQPPRRPEAPIAASTAHPAPVLAGDLVAGLTAAVGADRAAKWVAEKLTGVPNCGCERRRIALNELDAKARRLLKRLSRGSAP